MERTPLENWIAHKIGLLQETLSRDAIDQYQLAQIRHTVALARENSDFYRNHLSRYHPSEIRCFDDFSELPFTYPQDIRNNPLGFVCASPKAIERIVTLQSSGTTGEPKRIYFTKEDQELTIDFFDHGMRNLVGPGDRVLVLLPWQLPGSVGDLLRIALERLGAVPVPYGIVRDSEHAIAMAVEYRVNSMVGIPTQVLGMARHRKGRQLAGKVKSVLLSTDYVPESICRALETLWDCRVFNHYGMTEMGLGGGVQCSALLGYHLREADLYFEVVDPQTGEPLPEGKLGEIVFTTLTREGMPLIRYRTGDLSRYIAGNCPCGTVLRSMEIVRHRVSGRLNLAGKDFDLAELDEALFSVDGVVDFRAGLSNVEGREVLTIDVWSAEGSSVDFTLARRAVNSIQTIRQGIARGAIDVVVGEPSHFLPVSTGTTKRTIIDKR